MKEKSPATNRNVVLWSQGYMHTGRFSEGKDENFFFIGNRTIAECWVDCWAEIPEQPLKNK